MDGSCSIGLLSSRGATACTQPRLHLKVTPMQLPVRPAGAILQLQTFLANNVWLQFFLFWLFGMAMTSFACFVSVFLQNSQSAGNASLAMILVSWRVQGGRACGGCRWASAKATALCMSACSSISWLCELLTIPCMLSCCMSCNCATHTGGLDLSGAVINWHALLPHHLLHQQRHGQGVFLGLCALPMEPSDKGRAGHVGGFRKPHRAR